MRFEILAEAEAELREAALYYQGKRAGLGDEFADEAYRVFELMTNFPQIGTMMSDDIRRHPLRRFPFHVVYRVDRERIMIIAVAHDRRDPEYWISRLES